MTDDRHKPSGGQDSVARTTARDVPFMRGDSEAEPAPRGKRPAQLPRDPTYEQELAQVELAVLRNPERRDDPSTKQAGRRGADYASLQPPESVTPESPGARASFDAQSRSPNPPSSGGRAVASGTLLSIGSVDPRGKTERTLETPRMFFSQSQQAEAYFKPGAIPAVTVHQTLETETVKLSDSIDPRRAKTIPRLDRAALARLAELENVPESEGVDPPTPHRSSLDIGYAGSPRWNQDEYDADPRSYSANDYSANADGQIHASLSPFREQVESELELGGVPTRAEPLAARRSDLPPVSLPEPSAIPTQRDLPVHRIEASRPPPPPVAEPASAPRSALESALPASESPSPTTASIAAEAPERRSAWINYAAFLAALLTAVVLGLWLTREPNEAPATARPTEAPREARPVSDARPTPLPLGEPAPQPPADAASPGTVPPAAAPAPTAQAIATAEPAAPRVEVESLPAPRPRSVTPPPQNPFSASPTASARKAPPIKPSREPIF